MIEIATTTDVIETTEEVAIATSEEIGTGAMTGGIEGETTDTRTGETTGATTGKMTGGETIADIRIGGEMIETPNLASPERRKRLRQRLQLRTKL